MHILQFLCLIHLLTPPHKLFALVLIIKVIYLSIVVTIALMVSFNISGILASPRRANPLQIGDNQLKIRCHINYNNIGTYMSRVSNFTVHSFLFSEMKINQICLGRICQCSYLMLHVDILLSSTILHNIFLVPVIVKVIRLVCLRLLPWVLIAQSSRDSVESDNI